MAFDPGSLFHTKRLLVIRPDEIGDFVLTSAFLRELRHSAPTASITLVVKAGVRSLADACPYVDRVLTYDWESCPWTRWRSGHMKWKAFRLWLSSLAGTRFDRVLLPRRDDDNYGTEFLASLCAGPEKIARCRVVFSSHESDGSPDAFVSPVVNHEVEHTLAFLTWCGGRVESNRLEAWTTPEDEDWAQDYLEAHHLIGGFLLVVHPSGGKSRLKQWPLSHYAEILRALKIQRDFSCLIVGGPEDREAAQFLQEAGVPLINAVGGMSLRQMTAVMRRANLFFGGDSGPMHIAAAAGTGVVTVFGPTNIVRFQPYGENHRIISRKLPCSPNAPGQFQDRCWECIYPQPTCLTDLPVDVVLREILQAWPGSAHRTVK